MHASSVREEQNLTLRHNSLHCSYTGPFINGDIGCSADLTGYPDFAPVKNNTVDANLFVASPGSGFCAYGGATSGKPFSSDPTNATNQKLHQQRVPARHQPQVRLLRAGDQLRPEPDGQRLVGQRVGRREGFPNASNTAPTSPSPPTRDRARSPRKERFFDKKIINCFTRSISRRPVS